MQSRHSVGAEDARRLQLLIDSVVDYAIYMIGLDGLVMTWNSGARGLKGYEASEIIGKPYATFFTPEDLAANVPQRALKVAAETGRFECEGWRIERTAVASGLWR